MYHKKKRNVIIKIKKIKIKKNDSVLTFFFFYFFLFYYILEQQGHSACKGLGEYGLSKTKAFYKQKREQKKKSGKRATDKIICWFQESMDYFGSTLVYTYRHSFIYNNNNIIIIITIMTVYFDVAWHVEWEPTKDYFFLKTNHYLISAGCTHDSCGLFCGYVTAYYHVSPSMQRACVLYRKSKDFIWVLRGCWCCRCFSIRATRGRQPVTLAKACNP